MIVGGALLLDRVANSNLNPEGLCGSYVVLFSTPRCSRDRCTVVLPFLGPAKGEEDGKD
jgi:hypothetical protein